jgi:hypothetical protein
VLKAAGQWAMADLLSLVMSVTRAALGLWLERASQRMSPRGLQGSGSAGGRARWCLALGELVRKMAEEAGVELLNAGRAVTAGRLAANEGGDRSGELEPWRKPPPREGPGPLTRKGRRPQRDVYYTPCAAAEDVTLPTCTPPSGLASNVLLLLHVLL